MSLLDLLNRRRSVRHYDENQPIDANVVKECLRAAQLAPTSSNMQLYELYHVTDPAVLNKLAAACMHQQAAKTAQQMVVFVTRQDLYRRRAKAALEFERGNVERNSPAEKQKDRIKNWEMYYTKAMPLLYARCFGLLGASRAAMANCAGLFVPMILSRGCAQELRPGGADVYARDDRGGVRHLPNGRLRQPPREETPQPAAQCRD